jgi:hypothetical protein
MIITAVAMIRRGRGLERFRTVWLVEDTWIGVAVFGLACVAALVVGLIMRLAHNRQERREWRELDEAGKAKVVEPNPKFKRTR